MSKSILIVEDEETLRQSLKRIFTKDSFDVETAESAEKSLGLLEKNIYDVIISDIILPGADGIELLSRIRQEIPDQIFIVMTAYASLETAINALRAGAYDYIMKPVMHEEIKQVVKNALLQKRLKSENLLLKREIGKTFDFSSIIGQSPGLKSTIEEAKKIVDTRSNVLLLGETGTGKELFARVIHHNSVRRDMPFIPINCSVIPENLLESELFGHMKGAFTGALMSKKGMFEEADGGTVFLDEIGDIDPYFQIKMLRVLEDQLIRPVGSTKSLKVDLRFITATNRDLDKAVREGQFREDLYYRINTITLHIPPLRERSEDIPLLVNYFLEKYSREFQKQVTGLTDEALSQMVNYRWPGNVRELQNVIERAILITDSDMITPDAFPESMKSGTSVQKASIRDRLSIEDYTKSFILTYQDQYNEQQLAAMLGITRKSLWEKRKKWGIERISSRL
ncbi:MAG: sigma-54-dependent Fis family transcriptional regulator [Nitrospiraceae bacterium]|nr:MAG: sigma-54-dependent Fis family transcriptional regulator [Nitrospiraceae bacterium]